MLLTTTNTLEGQSITKYAGIVTGQAIVGANIFRDIFAKVRDIVGGRSAGYEKALSDAKDMAIQEMEDEARRLGCNAVIGVDLDYETVSGTMLMVSASGTAVVVA